MERLLCLSYFLRLLQVLAHLNLMMTSTVISFVHGATQEQMISVMGELRLQIRASDCKTQL